MSANVCSNFTGLIRFFQQLPTITNLDADLNPPELSSADFDKFVVSHEINLNTKLLARSYASGYISKCSLSSYIHGCIVALRHSVFVSGSACVRALR